MPSQNKFANPNNGFELGEDITCGCNPGADCTANFTYSYDPITEDLTINDASFLASGDSIVLVNGINVNVQDADGTAAAGSGDATAPIIINLAALVAVGAYRVDYDITTVNGCTSAGFLFFDRAIVAEHTGELSTSLYKYN